jgi:hypothetical protein
MTHPLKVLAAVAATGFVTYLLVLLISSEPAQKEPCETTGWGDWSDCVGGKRSKTRTVTNGPNAFNCPHLSEHENCEHEEDCAVTAWGVWSACDCEAGERYRLRTVISDPKGNGAVCPNLIEFGTCPCKKDCKVAEWSAWSGCNAANEQLRYRSILSQPKDGGLECPEIEESKICAQEYEALGYTSFMGSRGADWNALHNATTSENCTKQCDHIAGCKGVVWREGRGDCVSCVSDTCLKPTSAPSPYGNYWGFRKK